ncbi:hypothetical protein NIES4075_74320 [Tolypothrix sp. NIES-4075]|uniref:hypothetical protein n=1 Tax=Tolypothrix sp. NIES-4075 TaxID=2005459 RepID=UPI000B5C2222|nr:hypothetical protein [Tolypothrix sp. NIES-4075]GAX46408.1 hypothetical protein NIES4075_74320 [Tolypothrix sp. NIES-4075]
MNKHQSKSRKIIPFTGEFYPEEVETTPAPSPVAGATFVFIAAALVSGLALGAISTYQSADQQQLRQMQTDQQQL